MMGMEFKMKFLCAPLILIRKRSTCAKIFQPRIDEDIYSDLLVEMGR
jgi:hypothetical protein